MEKWDKLFEVLKKIKEKGGRLCCIGCIDKKVLVYTLWYENKGMNIYLELKDTNAKSITEIFKNADFYEREIYEKFGINFEGHPNLKRLFTPKE